jgi:polyisoprenoid-binding protein YceI
VTRYLIVPHESRVWVDARSSLHPIHSTTDGLEGFLDLEAPENGEIVFTTPPAGHLSLAVELLSTGNGLEDRELRKRIDVGRYPSIEGFLSTVDRVDGTDRYRVGGELEVRGVSRPCKDEMRVTRVDETTVHLEGKSTFDIRDFGIEPPRLFMLRVEPTVTVRVEIVARTEAS